MNTTQTSALDYDSTNFLEPEMANLLQMTNNVVLKIKQQTREMSL